MHASADPQADVTTWLTKAPTYERSALSTIAETDIFEVVASKEYVAIIRDLPVKSVVKLLPSTASYYTGHYFNCRSGTKPFLVRAVYGHGGTGGYEVARIAHAIWVQHSSLGHTSPANRSALILCLDFKPDHVYNTISIAE
jgi:hypothetical protein